MDPPLANNSINNSEQIQTSSLDNSNHDDNVRIAATALSDMRAGASHSNSGTPPITPNATDQAVSRLPAVLNSAMNLYDYGKANSRVISYGAGMVESGVQAISRPVLDRLPARVLNYGRSEPPSAVTPSPPAPLLPAITVPTPMPDEPSSSSMQLDTSERESSSSDPAREEQRKRAESWTHQQRQARRLDNGENSERPDSTPLRTQIGAENDGNDHRDYEDEEERMDLSNPDRTQSSTLSDTTRFSKRSDSFASPSEGRKNSDIEPSQAVSRRAGWQSLMVEAGGISAAVSDESMRKLKYCLEWLQWATANLDTQITLLETFIASINATVTGEPVPSSATVSPEALQHYMSVKRNVVNTIRQVVEVVGKYAGGSLPEPAKQKVKGFILSLPGRWSVAVKDAGLGEAGWDASSPAAAALDGSDPASVMASGRAGPSSNVNPRKRNRLESSSLSLASEATTGSSGATITGNTISTAPSSVDLAAAAAAAANANATPNVPATANSTGTPGRTGAGLPPGVTKRSQLLPPTAGAARHAAHRVLTLAQESLHAVRGVTGVFKDTLDRAETWVQRFRRVGYGQSHRYIEDSDASGGSSRLLRPPPKHHHSQSPSPSISSPRGLERRRLQMTPRELHLEALARSMPSVGPYGPYGTGNTPPMSPVLGPQSLSSAGGKDRNNVFPFDNPAPGYGWVGGRRKSDSGLSAVPTLNLSETNQSGRSRAGSMSQYESSTGESLPPPSVIGSTSSVAGDDEDEDGDYERQRGQMAVMGNNRMDEDDGIEYRVRKRRRKEEMA